MLSFERSIEILNEIQINQYQTQKLYLMECLGYVLAEDIIADHNSPAFPVSAMDGYALRYDDMELERVRIAGITPAGFEVETVVEKGVCVKTFTGSLMPKGADTLIPIENVTVEGEMIKINQKVPFGFAVRAVGENYAQGEKLIARGTTIDFAQIGVIASLNIVTLAVYKKPTVAILSTGSELLEIGETQTNDAQIRSSNNYILEAIVQKYGGKPLQMGCIGDDKQSIAKALSQALYQSDIVVTTGGVSVGDFDFVKDVIFEMDAEILFKGVDIKPGQHIMVAKKGEKFIVGLPGFAYSATVTALLYLVPLISKLQNTRCKIQKVKAILEEPFVKRSSKSEFTACNISLREGRYYVNFRDKKVGTSAILTNMLGEVALLVTSQTESSKQVGESVEILLLA